jgi:predicted lipid carrier protein YhbT
LDEVDPQIRVRNLPERSVVCVVKDLDIAFTAHLDGTGVHDIAQVVPTASVPPQAEVKVSVHSDDLVALADGEDDLLGAWLHGRVQVSAPVRDMLRLRALLGM